MKPIKITSANRAALEAALTAINGKATAHTADAGQLLWLADSAETNIIALVGTKKDAVGAVVGWRSGDALPSAYKYSRQTTAISIIRKAKHWYLIDARPILVWREAGKMSIILTQAQDKIAINKLQTQYYVSPKQGENHA